MAITPVGRMQTYELKPQVEPRPAPRTGDAAATETNRDDRVSLSPEALKLQAGAALLRQPLAGVEGQIGALNARADQLLEESYGALLERAGRSDYLASIANPTDLSPEATSERILGGITGYIYEAYKLKNPDLDEAKLADFQAQVNKGFDTGMSEARRIITSMSLLDDATATNIGKTELLVRQGLEDFFKAELERLRGTDTSERDTALRQEREGAPVRVDGPSAAERTQRPRRLSERNDQQLADSSQGGGSQPQRRYAPSRVP